MVANQMLVLYGTQGCHLCESAAAVLQSLHLCWCDIDIADDEQLLDRFATTIPVLLRVSDGSTLCWPFDADAVRRWLQS